MWRLVPLLTGTTLASATLKLCPYLIMYTLDLDPVLEIEQCWPIGYHHQTCFALLAVVPWGCTCVGPLPAVLPSLLPKPYGAFPPHTQSRQASGRDSYNG